MSKLDPIPPKPITAAFTDETTPKAAEPRSTTSFSNPNSIERSSTSQSPMTSPTRAYTSPHNAPTPTNPTRLNYVPAAPIPAKVATPTITDVSPPKPAVIVKASERGRKVTEEALEYIPNEREYEPPDLEDAETGAQVCRSQQPEFDDDGDACGLAHATSNAIEPQATFEAPHDASTPATNDVTRSASESRPPTVPVELPLPHVVAHTTSPTPSRFDWATEVGESLGPNPVAQSTPQPIPSGSAFVFPAAPTLDPDDVMPAYITPAVSVDPALANPPPSAPVRVDWDPGATTFDTPAPFMDIHPAPDSALGSYFPAIFANHVPRANLVNNMPPRVPPTAPVHVDPVAIAATAARSDAATATPTCFAFAMLSCRRAASFHQFVLEEVLGGSWRGFGLRTRTFAC